MVDDGWWIETQTKSGVVVGQSSKWGKKTGFHQKLLGGSFLMNQRETGEGGEKVKTGLVGS